MPTSVVTLLVSPADAERLTLAADEGKMVPDAPRPVRPGADAEHGSGSARLTLSRDSTAPGATTVGHPGGPARAETLRRSRRLYARIYKVETIRPAKNKETFVEPNCTPCGQA